MQDRGRIVPFMDRMTLDRYEDVARLEPGRRRGPRFTLQGRLYPPDPRRRHLCTVGGEDRHEDDKTEDEVRERSCAQDDRALPRLLGFEDSRRILRRDLFEGVHACDADEASERQRLHPILGLTLLYGPEARSEPDEELVDLDTELLRGDEVAELVQPDRQQDRDDEKDDPEGRHEHASMRPCASARAQRSASSTASSVS